MLQKSQSDSGKVVSRLKRESPVPSLSVVMTSLISAQRTVEPRFVINASNRSFSKFLRVLSVNLISQTRLVLYVSQSLHY